MDPVLLQGFSPEAAKFIGAGLAIGLGVVGPASASAFWARGPWRPSGATPRLRVK